MSNTFPKLHNATWPGVVGKGEADEPHDAADGGDDHGDPSSHAVGHRSADDLERRRHDAEQAEQDADGVPGGVEVRAQVDALEWEGKPGPGAVHEGADEQHPEGSGIGAQVAK